MTRRVVLTVVAVLVATGGMVLSACGSGRNQTTRHPAGGTINVAIVDNPNEEDLAHLTPSLFTAKTHINVNYTVLDEGTLRELVDQDLSTGSHQFDVVMIGPYEAPQYGKDGYIVDLSRSASSDKAYDVNGIIPSVRDALSYHGQLYASPFYGESSFLMYRKDVLKAAGITMPAKPTWTQVAAIARRINSPRMAGICLRGKAGWGELGATFTTLLNTFGGTWWSANPDGSVGRAMVDQPEFLKALEFYVSLVRDAGESDASRSSYNECLADYLTGKVAMWYDATVAAGLLEASDSAVRGKNGYAAAPVELTRSSAWLWSWAFAIPTSSNKANLDWQYIAWASGPQYIAEAGPKIPGGWAAIPPGTRRSTYEIPQYRDAARAFAGPTLEAIKSAPVDDPGTTRRPGNPGVQYVGVPQFQSVGDQCTAQFSAVIAGKSSIGSALANCQEIASGAAP